MKWEITLGLIENKNSIDQEQILAENSCEFANKNKKKELFCSQSFVILEDETEKITTFSWCSICFFTSCVIRKFGLVPVGKIIRS